jgi:hypothetical protein
MFTGILISGQIGILESFITKVIAVNTKRPKFQILLFNGIKYATAAGFLFAGL